MNAIARVMEGISAEISSLREQRHAALAEAERADKRLKELSGRKAPLPAGTFPGEREGKGELLAAMEDLADVLNKESAVLSRTKALAEEAARELDRLILEAEVRYHEAEKRLAQRRYEELCMTRYSIDGEAEQAVANLAEVLDRLESLHTHQVRVAADAEAAYLVEEEVSDMIGNWLARRFGRWLPLGSPDKYDAPLPELDALALKPESERGGSGVVGARTT
jgi:hypothetical protein